MTDGPLTSLEQAKLAICFGRLLAIYEQDIDPFPRPRWVRDAAMICAKIPESGFINYNEEPKPPQYDDN